MGGGPGGGGGGGGAIFLSFHFTRVHWTLHPGGRTEASPWGTEMSPIQIVHTEMVYTLTFLTRVIGPGALGAPAEGEPGPGLPRCEFGSKDER